MKIFGKNIQHSTLRCCTPACLGHIWWHDTNCNDPIHVASSKVAKAYRGAKTSNIPLCNAVPLLALATFSDANTNSNDPINVVSSKVAKAYKGAKTLIIPCCDAVPLLALSTFGDATWIVMILFMLRHPRWPKHIGGQKQQTFHAVMLYPCLLWPHLVTQHK